MPQTRRSHDGNQEKQHREQMSKYIAVHEIKEKTNPRRRIGPVEKIVRSLRAPLSAKHLSQTRGIGHPCKPERDALRGPVPDAVSQFTIPAQKPHTERGP